MCQTSPTVRPWADRPNEDCIAEFIVGMPGFLGLLHSHPVMSLPTQSLANIVHYWPSTARGKLASEIFVTLVVGRMDVAAEAEQDPVFSCASSAGAAIVFPAPASARWRAKSTPIAMQTNDRRGVIRPGLWSGRQESTREQPSKFPPATVVARSGVRRCSPSGTTSRSRRRWRRAGRARRCA